MNPTTTAPISSIELQSKPRSSNALPKSVPYLTLDAWRGVASIWVVMVHACLPIYAGPYPDLARQPIYAFSMQGALGVQLFFVISGYCIINAAASSLRRDNTILAFVKARIRRIYPPYLFAALLAFLLSVLASHVLVKVGISSSTFAGLNVLHQRPLWYLGNLTLTQLLFHQGLLIDVFWTLNYEVAFYAIVALMMFARTE
jgi:peptidoglycan/LPS O-acetylase OafA/YrhL